MMMRGPALCERPGFRLAGIAEGCQRHRQDPHCGPVARVAWRKCALDRSVHHVAADAAAAGVADVDGAAFQPGCEFFADIAGLESSAAQDRAAERHRHLGVVGHLSRFEPQPAAAGNLAMDTVFDSYLALGHELDRGAEGIADGKAEICGQGPVFHGQGSHA